MSDADVTPSLTPQIVWDQDNGTCTIAIPGTSALWRYTVSTDRWEVVTDGGLGCSLDGLNDFGSITANGGAAAVVDGNNDWAYLANSDGSQKIVADGDTLSSWIKSGHSLLTLVGDINSTTLGMLTKYAIAGEFDTGKQTVNVADDTETVLYTLDFTAMPSGLGDLGATGFHATMTCKITITDPTATPGTANYQTEITAKFKRNNGSDPELDTDGLGGDDFKSDALTSFPGAINITQDTGALIVSYIKYAAYNSDVQIQLESTNVYEVAL